MSAPIVLVTCDSMVHNGLDTSAAPATYLNALAIAGLVPLQLPTISEAFPGDRLLEVADGILVTGARSNVHPPLYGEAETEAAAPFDHLRDRTTLPLIRAALDAKIPLFCICRGIQELNVALGGTLHAEVHTVPGRDDHRGSEAGDIAEKFQIKQDAIVRRGGLLEGIYGEGPVRVNSVHRQAIDRVAGALFVEATAPDGTVEAVSVPRHPFALGVQWHPEYFVRDDAPSRAVFDAFAAAVRHHAHRGERAAA